MSGAVLGALVKTEEAAAAGGFQVDSLERFRFALTTAFAAVGDAFFWNAILPAASILSLFFSFHSGWPGAVCFLILFNAGHLFIRLWGFKAGYEKGVGIAYAIDRLHLPVVTLKIRLLSSAALGALGAWALNASAGDEYWGIEFLLIGLGAYPLLMAAAYLMKRGLPVEFFIYGAVALVFAVGLVFN